MYVELATSLWECFCIAEDIDIVIELTFVAVVAVVLLCLYYYMRNFCNLIGLEQWYFSLIWNTYMWKLQTFCG